jgi:hypothetical protein
VEKRGTPRIKKTVERILSVEDQVLSGRERQYPSGTAFPPSSWTRIASRMQPRSSTATKQPLVRSVIRFASSSES